MVLRERREATLTNSKMVIDLACDHCQTEFSRHENVAVHRRAPRHYCGRACFKLAMKPGGIADESRKATNRELHGADYKFARPDIASRSGKLAHTPELELRRWAKIKKDWEDNKTRLSRGLTLTRSREEVQFFERFCKEFSVACTCPCYTNGWFIDGRVNETPVYLQFDGVYWHSSEKNQTRDRAQDAWFAEQGLTLVRITDKEWRKDPTGVLSSLREKLADLLGQVQTDGNAPP